ncbi:MAG TPA: DUF4272 domain-containing protein [Povalibacter sp.]|nr:DUF4272 domain-containing protein [Povalibacter sp.]
MNNTVHIDYRRLFTSLVLIASFCAAPHAAAPTPEDRKIVIESREKMPAPEALQRKARSEALLKRAGVPVNVHLPVIETEAEARKRSKEEVAHRALALLVVAVKGEGLEQEIVERLIRDYGLGSHLTPQELAFVRDKSPSQQDRVQFSWRYEAAWVLLWALGFVDELKSPDTICDVPRAVSIMKERSTQRFIADAKLRPLAEILDQADLIYRYDWAVVEGRVNGEAPPASVDPGVVQERHYALNWLIGYMNQEWDDVSTDT